MKKVMGTEVKVKQATVDKVVADELMSKSGKMKTLFDFGMEVKEIAAVLGVRYNFVYNVVSNYVAMNGIPVESSKKESKKDDIIRLYLEGKSNKEISIALKTNYNYVFNTLKQYKKENTEGEAK